MYKNKNKLLWNSYKEFIFMLYVSFPNLGYIT